MSRLHPQRLAELPAEVARPRYDRGALQPGIVHLGLGAFARAHLAVFNEASLHATSDLRWGIVGVSLREATMRDALEPQAGLYTVNLRSAAADGTPHDTLQVVGCVQRSLCAPADPRAVLDAIADAATRIVSLTVTEKGYHRTPASGALCLADADIAHDLAHPDAPRTALGFIVHGLAQRRAARHAPLALLSCDNLPANGDALQGLVLAFAEQVDAGLRDWIATKCTFPNSVVDRIVPRASGTDRARIASATGLLDAAPVVAEPYADWVVEDRFANGRPAWDLAGARFVDDAAPHERAKLRIVNGSHSALAYLGTMAGWRSVDQAIAVPALRRYLDALLREEVVPTLGAVPGLDLVAYRARMFERFANPALQHATAQIAMDGSQKLPQRLLGTVRDRVAAHRPIERLALAVAAWLHYLSGTDETGATHAIDDPLANALAEQLARAEATGSVHDGVACMLSFAPVFGALAAEPRFVSAVTRHVLSLRQRGVPATLERLAV